jgi:pSer/pThr/pTyr-binding forkhead associated (FHA) protein
VERNGTRAGAIHPLGALATIGRDPGCDVVLADPAVSPLHAEIAFTAGGVTFRGRTGATVSRREAPDGTAQVITGTTTLVGGDTLLLGDTRLTMLLARDAVEGAWAMNGTPRP